MNDPVRILVGRLWHESNGFNPQPTTKDEFQFRQGEAMLEGLETSGSTLSGIVQQLKKLGATLVPSLSLTAPPSGLIEHEFYAEMRDRLIEIAVAEKPDAIALELHGAMGTTKTPDADGDLLTRLREAVGFDVPIGIGLDLHAHVTNAMLEAVDVCIACKENPHADVVECGEDLAGHMMAILRGELAPITIMAKVPMVLPGAADTLSGPLTEVHAEAREFKARHSEIKDISLFNVFRYADDDDIGQAAVILCDKQYNDALDVADSLVHSFWEKRSRFVDELLSIEETLDLVAGNSDKRPFVIADMGDRVLAGAPGDSVAFLKAALQRDDGLKGALPITDPQSAKAAAKAGVGAKVTLKVGGRITPGFSPLEVTGEVVHVSDGDFILEGPFQGGEKTSMGTSAVLLVDGRISVLLTTRPAFSHDPGTFTSQNIMLAEQDFLIVKSGYHFKLNFADKATPVLMRSPGVGYYTKGFMDYKKSVFWPEHQIDAPFTAPRIYDHSRIAKSRA